jgi:trimeric autotransporter adhesin
MPLALAGATVGLMNPTQGLAQTEITGLPSLNGGVKAMHVVGSTLYLAGDFTTVGASTRNGLAAIDLVTKAVLPWNPSGANSVSVSEFDFVGSTVYATGRFSTIGTNNAARENIAALDLTTGAATTWNVGSNNGFSMNSIRVSPTTNTAFVWGDFTTVQGTGRATGFAAFSTTTGVVTNFAPSVGTFGNGTVGSYRDMVVSPGGNLLLAYGNANVGWDTNTVYRRGYAELDGSTGSPTGLDLMPYEGPFGAGATGLAVLGDDVIIAGTYTSVLGAVPPDGMGTARNHLSRFDLTIAALDSGLDPAALGPDGTVRRLALSGDVLYAIGEFSSYGGASTAAHAVALDPATGLKIPAWNVPSGSYGGTASRVAASSAFVALSNGTSQYAVWTAVTVPEPSTALLVGAVTLLPLRRRRQLVSV